MAFGMDPEVARYFRKILRSLFAGLMWLFSNITLGIYFKMAYGSEYAEIVHILFYIWLSLSLAILLWYLYRVWKK